MAYWKVSKSFLPGDSVIVKCSNCGKGAFFFSLYGETLAPACPSCGCTMDEPVNQKSDNGIDKFLYCF